MKDKILKLCKRLKSFSIQDLSTILCISKDEIKTVLDELIKNNNVEVINGTYNYNDMVTPSHQLPFFFKLHTKEELNIIIKGFCSEIKTAQLAFIIETSDATIQKFNMYFRKIIYEKQLMELKVLFELNPKTPKMRTFYDVAVYFYLYDNKLFVVDKPLKSKKETAHSKQESLHIKVLYSRLKRWINHSNQKKLMHHHIADGILRYGKTPEEIMKFLYANF